MFSLIPDIADCTRHCYTQPSVEYSTVHTDQLLKCVDFKNEKVFVETPPKSSSATFKMYLIC